MANIRYFIYLGCAGFPYGLAEIKKMTLISKSLVSSGHSVTIIAHKGVHDKAKHPDLPPEGNYEGIHYIYTSGSPFRSENFFKRNLLKVRGMIRQWIVLHRMKKNKQLDFAVLSTHKFRAIVYYFFLSRIFGFKTILNHVEFYSGVKFTWARKGDWINDKLYDTCSPFVVDYFFPISEYLISYLQKVTPKKKFLKIPILTEFEKYNDAGVLNEGKYFFFSGDAAHNEIILFIIDSFCLLNSDASLFLGIKGDTIHVLKVEKYINDHSLNHKVKVFSTLNEKQLYSYYKNAIALLIPLRPTIQDAARFPHKIGEYLASGNPVVSTNFGEVKHYFRDLETMLIAPQYDKGLFAAKMQYVLDFPEEARKIGEKGKELAWQLFNYRMYGDQISSFLEKEKA